MTNPNTPINPEHRRVAAGKFEHANRVVATGNYDYGIHLLLDCCQMDPGNLIYRQALRRTEKAKYRNNLRGSVFAWLTTWPVRARMKAANRARDFMKVIEYGESILMRNPWDVGAQMEMAEAADNLGMLDLAVWNLEQARQKLPFGVSLNRALANLYEKRGNFTQAIALWELIRKVKPSDTEAQRKIKDLAADDTIVRGQYHTTINSGEESAEGSPKPAGQPRPKKDSTAEAPVPASLREGITPASPSKNAPAKVAPPKETTAKPKSAASIEVPIGQDRLEREAAPLRTRLKADPTSAQLYLQLAAVYRRANDLAKARAVLQEGLGPTGNSFELSLELADIDIEPFRRDLAITEEKFKADPENAELRRLRTRLNKEINTRELDIHRQKADRYPTEMSHRYEVGVRLLRADQIDEAIRELQASRKDPRHRWQSLLHLGYCFKSRNNWRLAQSNFEEALKGLPAGDAASRKEILYELAVGCAASNDLSKAIDMGTELANLDFSYREIGRLLDEWHTRGQQANVSH